MKPKKLNKKLSLNKKTVADLNVSEMGHLKGGCLDTDIRKSGCVTDNTCMIETCPTDCGASCGVTICTCISFCTIVGNCC